MLKQPSRRLTLVFDLIFGDIGLYLVKGDDIKTQDFDPIALAYKSYHFDSATPGPQK